MFGRAGPFLRSGAVWSDALDSSSIRTSLMAMQPSEAAMRHELLFLRMSCLPGGTRCYFWP